MGPFLKKWDSRAEKEIKFIPVETESNLFALEQNKKVKVYNKNVEDIISGVDCDILYLDPPYTQNQYGTQYHLLETLVLNDNPILRKVEILLCRVQQVH